MKVISIPKIKLLWDREGQIEEHLMIEIIIEKKDSNTKLYHIKTIDSVVRDKGLPTENTTPFLNRYGTFVKNYAKAYEEYDQQKAALEAAYPTQLTGSEKDDYLLAMALINNLSTDPICGLTGNQWEVYTPPVIIPE